MSQAGADAGDAASGSLGQKNLTTMHAVAQALAIGPMFSVALILGGVSRPDIGAGWNATLAVLLAGLGVVAIAYTISLYARKFAGRGPSTSTSHTARTHGLGSSSRGSSSPAPSSSAAAASTSVSGSSATTSGRRASPTTAPPGGSGG